MNRVAMAALIAAAAGLGCESGPARIDGKWGAEGVEVNARADGATIDYTCFRVTTEQPLALDASRQFRVDGIRTPGGGGPERLMYFEEPVVVKGVWIPGAERVRLVLERASGEELALFVADADTFFVRRGPGSVLPCPMRWLDATSR